jgi:hypothetical protein
MLRPAFPGARIKLEFPGGDMTETLIAGYAHIAHAGGDKALRAGWREYLRDKMAQLEGEFPGISAAVRERMK